MLRLSTLLSTHPHSARKRTVTNFLFFNSIILLLLLSTTITTVLLKQNAFVSEFLSAPVLSSEDRFIHELYKPSSSTKTCSISSLLPPLDVAIILSGSIRVLPEIFERYDEELLHYTIEDFKSGEFCERQRNPKIDFFVTLVYEREEELEKFNAMKETIPNVRHLSLCKCVKWLSYT